MKKFAIPVLVMTTALAGPSAVAADRGFYVSGGGGMNWVNDIGDSNVSISMKEGYSVLGAVGYDTGDTSSLGKFRVESEISYTENKLDEASSSGTSTPLSGKLKQLGVLINAYVDFLPDSWVRPYLGAGVGVVEGDISANINGTSAGSKGTEFAYQGMAGVSAELRQGIHVDVGYRYRRVEANTAFDNQAVIATLRLTL